MRRFLFLFWIACICAAILTVGVVASAEDKLPVAECDTDYNCAVLSIELCEMNAEKWDCTFRGYDLPENAISFACEEMTARANAAGRTLPLLACELAYWHYKWENER